MTENLTQQLPQTADEKLTLILTIVQSLTIRVDNIDSRLQRVEQTVGESRPILQRLVIDVEHLKEGQRRLEDRIVGLDGRVVGLEGRIAGLEDRVVGLEGRIDDLKEGQEALRSELRGLKRHVDYRFMILSGNVLAQYMKLEQRVTILELGSTPPNSQT